MAKSVTASRKASSADKDVELGSGNVFADLGLDSPDERQLRVKLAIRLNDLIAAEGLTQAAAAKRLGIAQPHVSELKNYKLSRYSSERLMHLITLLNRDVEIFIRPRASPVTSGRKSITAQVGQVSVWAAA
jgi:predicted XRE-type DNA-binding protein